MKKQMLVAVVCATVALCSIPAARAADADVTGLEPTIWWDFESQPAADGLTAANKGSASISFTHEGTKKYSAGAIGGTYAFDTSRFTAYSGAGSLSTAGNPFTLSLVMTLGTKTNGITLNVQTSTGDLIIRRGAGAGSLVVGWGAKKDASSQFLNATFADGDAAWHLVSIVCTQTDTKLYVDGKLADSSMEFTPWSESGKATQMQFGGHLGVGKASGEEKGGGLIDDLRIHDAALTPAQIKAIAQEYRLSPMTDALKVSGSPGNLGTVVPRYGITNGLAQADVIACSAASSESATVKIVPVGYGLYSVAADGTETLVEESAATSFTYTHGTTGAHLVWRWASSNYVEVVSGGGGTVSSGGWAEAGGSFAATATPAAGHRFHHWECSTPLSDRLSPSVVIPSVAEPLTLTAVFIDCSLDVSLFGKLIPITVSGYAGTSDLACFPVLVKLSPGSPTGFDYSDCAEDGSDLRFLDANGALVPHEIESWNRSGDSFIWVQVPVLSSTTTALSLYYGADPTALPAVDPKEVWTHYAVVVHGGSGISDSSPSALAVANGGGVEATSGSGIVAGGLHKAVRNSKGVNIPNPVTNGKLSNTKKFTLTTWYKAGATGTSCMSASKSGWSGTGFLLVCESGSYMSVAVNGHQGASGKGKLVKDQWAHVAFSYDTSGAAGSLRTYFDGENIFSKDDARAPTDGGATYWTVGSYADAGSNDSYAGDMDEIRLFDGIASADWIKAEYDSVTDPASFVSLSSAEVNDLDLPRFGALSASDENGVATFSVALDRPAFGGAAPTSVSVFYGTDGENWTELPLGATNEVGTLTGAASGLTGNARYLWYASASATQDASTKEATSSQQSFVTRALEPAGTYKSFTATVDWDGEPVENVPVLLRISETAITGFDYDEVTESRFEIIDGDGRLLPYEIDTWNTDGESLVWVLLPDYRDGSTFTVRYGTPFANTPIPSTNIWAGYKGVWHMDSVDPADSTANGFKGTHKTANLSVVAGKIGSAMNVPRTSEGDGISCGQVMPNSELTDGFTVEGWCRPTQYGSMGDGAAMFGKKDFISVRIKDATHVIVTTPTVENHEMSLESGVLPAVGEWWHFAVTFKMNTPNNGLNFYVNGQLVKTQAAKSIKDTTSASEMFLGNNQWNQAFKGDLDEMRLSAGIRSANEIAAEYHAMGIDGALAFSPVASSDKTVPVLGIPSVARNADGSFTVSVEVTENVPAAIVCSVAGADYPMTTADASLPATYSALISGLADGTHVASVHATAANGASASGTCPTAFHSGSLTVVKQSDADEGTLTPGIFRVSRADADATGLPALTFDVAFSGPGLAAIVEPTVAALTIPAGAAYVDVSVTPIYTMEVDADAALTLSVSGAFIGTSSSGSIMIVNATFDPWVRYVATTGDDANHGGTPDFPKKTIGAAVESLATIGQTLPCIVHVAPGLYPITAPIALNQPILVLGDDSDPSRTIVSNKSGAGYLNGNQRVFTLNHADAFVANLTMQNGSSWGGGGSSFYIQSNGGMVSNCVVEAGQTAGNGASCGGGLLDAGRVTHTVFRKCTVGSGESSDGNQDYRPAVLWLKGTASAENCLLVDNTQNKSKALSLARLDGSSVMRNCTIVDSGLGTTNSYCAVFAPLYVGSANVTVQNVVVAGVTNQIDGALCRPLWGYPAKFLNGATDADISGLNYHEGTVTGTASSFFNDYANGDYTPKTRGPLVNKGANYEGMASVDLAGKKRLNGSKIDIGCYESQSSAFTVLIR